MKSAQGSPFPLGEPMPPPVLVVLPSEETTTTRSVTVGFDEISVRDISQGTAGCDHQWPMGQSQALGAVDDQERTVRPIRLRIVDVAAGRPDQRRTDAGDRIRQVLKPARAGGGDQIPVAAHVRLDVGPVGVLIHDDPGQRRGPRRSPAGQRTPPDQLS